MALCSSYVWQQLQKKCMSTHLVHEDILTAVIRGDEAPALGHIEPLAATLPRHTGHPTTAAAARTANCKHETSHVNYGKIHVEK